ncbi:MAG: NAD(P)-binding domain-containing protein, partial [Actinomycetota bacterium]
MQLGMIGLGRMGANLVRRLMRDGHTCVVNDVTQGAIDALVAEGASGASTLEALVQQLDAPRNIWIMVPAGIVQQTVDALLPLLDADDTIIDGGNSYYHDDIHRAAQCKERGVHYVDCGTSGGVWGLERGYCV